MAARDTPTRPIPTCGNAAARTATVRAVGNKRAIPGSPRAASAIQVGRQGFALDVTKPGRFLVRLNFTPYWSIGEGSGCLLRKGEWTIARVAHPGTFTVDADFSLGGAWNAMTGAKKTC